METPTDQKQINKLTLLRSSFLQSLDIYLQVTALHGLRFVGDKTLRTWERLFFLVSFIGAFIATCHLISNIYGKWESTPIIIGISPHPTAIVDVPFPAITLCNMNQVQSSQVLNYSKNSVEGDVLRLICNEQEKMPTSIYTENSNLSISKFILKHGQPCEKMLLYCRYGLTEYNCSELFREIITDEGLCCVFNMLPDEYLYKPFENSGRNLVTGLGYVPVKWNLEDGYPFTLPPKYYPRKGVGAGMSLGLSLILNAEIDDYYCSSTNGPGFKIFFHTPIQVPRMDSGGIKFSIGYETNFRIELKRSEAMPNIRSISKTTRKCLFKDEQPLLYYKIYTRRNCEAECNAKLLFKECGCIPFDNPMIYRNASVCSINDSLCTIRVKRLRYDDDLVNCRRSCFPTCFDYNYLVHEFRNPLATETFKVINPYIDGINKTYLSNNVAAIHLFYRESVYNGDMKNVYIGPTEFLSNIGGVLGLFLGFSFVSIAEVFYFLFVRPIQKYIQYRRHPQEFLEMQNNPEETEISGNYWLPEEICPKENNSKFNSLKFRN